MKIVVCIRQGLDGQINPFDACAYEAALQISGAEIVLLSMGPASAKDFLLSLTRLGAQKAVLLSDKAFAGADTLATAYTLSLAVDKIKPDLIFCGRQTLVGDTAQTGPMLSVYAKTSLLTNVMSIDEIGESITCTTRDMGVKKAELPALITVERINTLRLPSIFSKMGQVEVWNAEDLQADLEKCGLKGSPTRVIKTYENQSGKRKCTFIEPNKLRNVISQAVKNYTEKISVSKNDSIKLEKVFTVGQEPMDFAKTVSDDITVIPKTDAKTIAELVLNAKPNAVLWASDAWSKETSAKVSAMLNLGLCADCTALETDGKQLIMYRPALSGSIIAKIQSLTLPAMATVRTAKKGSDIVVGAGFGVRDNIEKVKDFAENIDAELAASRKLVDNGILPYDMQVGLTGKTVSAPVYIALGISGAVHHIVGMDRSGTIIAVNPDKNAPIFDYADYGIVDDFENVLKYI